MKLRTRILTGFAGVDTLFIALGFGVVASQRNQLTNQLDARLEAVVPLRPPRSEPAEGEAKPEEPAPVDQEVQEPISDVYIATKLIDGTIEAAVQGQLLDTVPDLSGVTPASDGRTIYNLDSADGSTSFRVLAEPVGPEGNRAFIAIPTTDVDETLQRLTVAFTNSSVTVDRVAGSDCMVDRAPRITPDLGCN